jgi:hypothetical protein
MGVNETTHRLREFAQSRLASRKLKESLRLTLPEAPARAGRRWVSPVRAARDFQCAVFDKNPRRKRTAPLRQRNALCKS